MQTIKYIKIHKVKKRRTFKCIKLNYKPKLNFKLIISVSSYLQEIQLEATRRVIVKRLLKIGTLLIHTAYKLPVIKKSINSRMGKGKGKVKYHTHMGLPGGIIISIFNVNKKLAYKSLLFSKKKLPVKTRIIL